MRGRRFRASAALAVAMVVAGGVPSALGASDDDYAPVVTNAVQVSDDPNPSRGYSTPQITRNPDNGVLVIADCDARNAKTLEVYRSFDDGRSWSHGGNPMMEPWVDICGNPDSNVNHTMTYDRNGVLYIAYQANDPQFSDLPKPDRPMHIMLARSDDDGATFDVTMVYEAPEAPEADRGLKRNDRAWVAVDPNEPRYVYVSWMQFHQNDPVPSGNKALIAASSDGGDTFGEPVSLREWDPQGSYEARPAVDGDGVVHIVSAGRGLRASSDDPPPIRSVYYRRSADHGATWSDPVMIEEANAGFAFNRKWGLKADPNNDNLYAVWYGHPDPMADKSEDDVDIYMRMSYDSGETWTDRTVINTDHELQGVHHYHPNISVAPNGRLDVVWYDQRHSPTPEVDGNQGFQDVYYRYSTDGGRTFSEEIKVTDRIIDRNYGIWSNNYHIHAPIGIVSSDEAAYIAWQDSRNGVNTTYSADDTYFASVQLFGTPPAIDGGAGANRGVVFAGGLTLGMGLAMIVAVGVIRRARG